METIKQTYLKPENLKLIQDHKIEGSKFFAYLRLLERNGSTIESGKYQGGKMLYLGGQNLIGAKVTKYKVGFKLDHINGTLNS